jgi:hypothetical protein
MYRAWQHTLSVGLVALVAAPISAAAFHAGGTYDQPSGAGGGGGIFYTGSPAEKGWTCAACHIDAPGRATLGLATEPLDLLTDERYVPEQTYQVTVAVVSERRGLTSPLSNYNGFVFTSVDVIGRAAGIIGGGLPGQLYRRDDHIIASAGLIAGETSWTFKWTAPPAGRGAVTFYIGMVDGDGGAAAATETLTDPFGDDVAVMHITVNEAP